jgi:hypothetical protein
MFEVTEVHVGSTAYQVRPCVLVAMDAGGWRGARPGAPELRLAIGWDGNRDVDLNRVEPCRLKCSTSDPNKGRKETLRVTTEYIVRLSLPMMHV